MQLKLSITHAPNQKKTWLQKIVDQFIPQGKFVMIAVTQQKTWSLKKEDTTQKPCSVIGKIQESIPKVKISVIRLKKTWLLKKERVIEKVSLVSKIMSRSNLVITLFSEDLVAEDRTSFIRKSKLKCLA